MTLIAFFERSFELVPRWGCLDVGRYVSEVVEGEHAFGAGVEERKEVKEERLEEERCRHLVLGALLRPLFKAVSPSTLERGSV